MWPATPQNPTLAIHRDLMEWLQALLLEGCIGVDAFCRAIDVRRGNQISKQLETKYCHFCVEQLLYINERYGMIIINFHTQLAFFKSYVF